MKYTLKVLRRKSSSEEPAWNEYELETEEENVTVATALSRINRALPEKDKIMWECSCLQKKCGACAMVIDGKPALACDARLKELESFVVTVEPLRKFPVIRDLVVDRSVLYRNLETIRSWLETGARASEENLGLLYEASRCLQCGCCLEVCPNFFPEGKFFGMASMVPVSRLLEELPPEQKKQLRKDYRKHIYGGCGKSLACRNICPAGIDIESLMVNSNAVSLWRTLLGR